MIKRVLASLTTPVLLVVWTGTSYGQATRPVTIGVNANFEHHLAQSAHIGWSRIDIEWRSVNPSPGVWDFGFPDAQVNEAVAFGQQILGILHNPPQWMGGGPNANIPPLTTTEWAEFVRRVAQRYAGRIAAYEIWNEPDQKSTSQVGIGWGRNIEEPPLYVDFVHAAAVEIRAQAPGTLVVAPAFLSRNDADGADNRKRRILQQIQAATYPDGLGHSFVDVVSIHNNAKSTENAYTMAVTANNQNLAYVWNHAPSLRTRPIWVTEFGWRSNAVGEAGQRERICHVIKFYTGLVGPFGTAPLRDWDVRRAFIYVLKEAGSSASIFRGDNSSKPVVTQYLQLLPYPATQNPTDYFGYPACNGTSSLQAVGGLGEGIKESFGALGLSDPRLPLPADFPELYLERSTDGKSLDAVFGDGSEAVLVVSISPASSDEPDPQALTEAGLAWRSGPVRISVTGMRSGVPLGKSFLRAVAVAIDPLFDRACMVESVFANDHAVRRLGFSPPKAPRGFVKERAVIELTRPTDGCGSVSRGYSSSVLDFTWTFASRTGAVIRAGIYRYDHDSGASFVGPASFHWCDGQGNRFWVAADAARITKSLRRALVQVAKSMDPTFEIR